MKTAELRDHDCTAQTLEADEEQRVLGLAPDDSNAAS